MLKLNTEFADPTKNYMAGAGGGGGGGRGGGKHVCMISLSALICDPFCKPKPYIYTCFPCSCRVISNCLTGCSGEMQLFKRSGFWV